MLQMKYLDGKLCNTALIFERLINKNVTIVLSDPYEREADGVSPNMSTAVHTFNVLCLSILELQS